MKIAHLILAHKNPAQIARLISRLKHPDANFFIHLDFKTDIQPFLYLEKEGKVVFIKNRIKVYWAGYSQVQSTVNSLQEISSFGIDFDYVNLISGQDYPLKRVEELHAYLEQNNGNAFMEYFPVYEVWKEAIPRVERYFLVESKLPGKYTLEALMNIFLPKRQLPGGLIPVGRSTWFTITFEQVNYILDYIKKHPEYSRFFKYSWGADELFFQTLIYNSPYKDKMVNDNLLYTDWSKGGANPKMLTIDDKVKLMDSGKFLARKFDEAVDKEILDFLDKQIAN